MRPRAWKILIPDEIDTFLSSCQDGIDGNLVDFSRDNPAQTVLTQLRDIREFRATLQELEDGVTKPTLLRYAVKHDGTPIPQHRVLETPSWHAFFCLKLSSTFAMLLHVSYVRRDWRKLEENSSVKFSDCGWISCGRDRRRIEKALAAKKETFLKAVEAWTESDSGGSIS